MLKGTPIGCALQSGERASSAIFPSANLRAVPEIFRQVALVRSCPLNAVNEHLLSEKLRAPSSVRLAYKSQNTFASDGSSRRSVTPPTVFAFADAFKRLVKLEGRGR